MEALLVLADLFLGQRYGGTAPAEANQEKGAGNNIVQLSVIIQQAPVFLGGNLDEEETKAADELPLL